MKNYQTACFIMLMMCFLCSKSLAQSNDNEDQVVKIEEQNMRSFRSGEVLVKFKDASDVVVRRSAPGRYSVKSKRVKAVTDLLGVTDMEQLMPVGGKKAMRRSARLRSSFTGKELEDRDMSQLYLVKFDPKRNQDVHQAIKTFEELDEVEFAEPNYVVYALGAPSINTVPSLPKTNDNGPKAFEPSDPMYNQQWGPSFINLPQFWATETQNVLGRRPVLAILDTGVDITHPDLKDNIWTNEKEANGVDGEDDDLDGYVDDLHGWDCVNQTGRLGDWNGHGTHCAGIAAAVADNGIGIVGANPDALIMPVTVLQSDGIGDVGTIIRGLESCLTHQVDVISMSLGSYGYS